MRGLQGATPTADHLTGRPTPAAVLRRRVLPALLRPAAHRAAVALPAVEVVVVVHRMVATPATSEKSREQGAAHREQCTAGGAPPSPPCFGQIPLQIEVRLRTTP